MRIRKSAGIGCAILLFCAAALAQPAAQPAKDQSAKDKTAIEQVLRDQETAWNNGDIDTFMHGYQNSPETTFIGKNLHRGYGPVLERYKSDYSTGEAMGKLDFSDLNVRLLDRDYAVVTGRYHLARTAAGGGDATGLFSLVFEREADGWRIILDHTS
jgi:uncharacterized protein (TIGR02246 family)